MSFSKKSKPVNHQKEVSVFGLIGIVCGIAVVTVAAIVLIAKKRRKLQIDNYICSLTQSKGLSLTTPTSETSLPTSFDGEFAMEDIEQSNFNFVFDDDGNATKIVNVPLNVRSISSKETTPTNGISLPTSFDGGFVMEDLEQSNYNFVFDDDGNATKMVNVPLNNYNSSSFSSRV